MRGRQGVDRGADRGRRRARGDPDLVQSGGGLLRGAQPGLSGGHLPGLAHRLEFADLGSTRIVRGGADHHRDPERGLHGNGIRGGGGAVRAGADDLRLPVADLGPVRASGQQGGQDDGRRIAADRHFGHLRLPDQLLRPLGPSS
ncbi:hypothetical protein G6F68_015947 [Rhizopus microsporus]|nr:hypothetical protein G6F68_015947 [Rhizopus microsporus]